MRAPQIVATSVQRLEDANLRLGSVLSDELGKSGRIILQALIAGETNPETLADLAEGRARKKRAELVKALQERIRDHHRGFLKVHLELVAALEQALADIDSAVHAGWKSISPEVSFQLAEHATDDALTAGEVRVLALIAEGRANKEIAKRLSISEATVKGQVQNILSKLGAKDRTHAAMIGLKRGIIQP